MLLKREGKVTLRTKEGVEAVIPSVLNLNPKQLFIGRPIFSL